MYLAYYGLQKEPFHTTPDPNFLFLSPSHKEALGAIIYGTEKKKGFIAIFGEVGVGKTTILRAYLEGKEFPKQKTIYIFNPVVSYHGLLTAIFRGLELVPLKDDVAEMVNQLHQFLIKEYEANRTVVLVIDEAQNMPIATLENLRMLSNLETATDKLIQIILLGQPELETLLKQPALRQFRQRISIRAVINPLTDKESQAYIEHRLLRATRSPLFTKGEPIFTKGALKLVSKKGEGIPRRLNILCDNALITGFGHQQKPVSTRIVREILTDIDGARPYSTWKWAMGVAAVMLLGISFLLFGRGILSENFGVTSIANVDNLSAPNKNVTQGKSPTQRGKPLATSSVRRQTLDPLSTPTRSATALPDIDLDEDSISNADSSNDVSEMAVALQRGNTKVEHENKTSGTEVLSNQPEVPTQSGKGSLIIRSVKRGDNLTKITQEIYGSTSPKYIDWVQRHNPEIVNPDFILPGQQFVLPQYNEE